MTAKSTDHDVVIIGGGPAGLTSGIYCSRARLDSLLIERGIYGGQAATTDFIENYPGFEDGISGMELGDKMKKQAERFGLAFKIDECLDIKNVDGAVHLKLSGGELTAKAVIIATGSEYKSAGVKGEDTFRSRGVSYCATCDGFFYRGKELIVIGGGDTAIQEALFLTRFASKVTIVHRRDTFRAQKILQEKVAAEPKIEVVWCSTVEEIKGDDVVREVVVRNVKTNEASTIPASGVFVFVGFLPNTHFLGDNFKKTEDGYLITDEKMQTSVSGVFAAGDCRYNSMKQVAVAVGEGALVTKYVEDHLEEL